MNIYNFLTDKGKRRYARVDPIECLYLKKDKSHEILFRVPSFNIMIGSTRPDPKFNLILGSTRSGPIVSQYPIENVHCCSSGNTWFHSTTSTRSCLFSAS
ncbi:hypothetical protein C4D60_Mb00t10390 [Musa balbisiana]|uniref:Uncharacterized protein n=1 Tax=Musa balbisiana TaxID=52838 RepID=A0A4S8I467_MUSBA|nr:hypothetical protein C4D60_Mb00t10390 [Musa balbisiana]